ncbi:MAG: peptidylprolyl isomerase [Polyangiaceae bacterium]
MRWLVVAAVLALVGCSDNSTSSTSSGAGGSGAGTSSVGGNAGTGGTMGEGGLGAGGMGTGGTSSPVIEIDTSMGMMAVQLDPERMPITTANFLTYVDEDYFASTIIHRVIPDFVIQGGGFTSGLTPKGGAHPPITLETHPELTHVYGAISMARTMDPNSATSQFFLVNAPNGAHSLDGNYAAFGILIEGSDVLDAISGVATQTQGQFMDVPVTEVEVLSITRR